jgi:hypothetical protein
MRAFLLSGCGAVAHAGATLRAHAEAFFERREFEKTNDSSGNYEGKIQRNKPVAVLQFQKICWKLSRQVGPGHALAR